MLVCVHVESSSFSNHNCNSLLKQFSISASTQQIPQIPLRIESHYDWEFQSHSHHGNLDHPKGRYRSQGEPHRPPVLAQGLCPTGAPSSRLHGLNVYQAGFFGMTRADKF